MAASEWGLNLGTLSLKRHWYKSFLTIFVFLIVIMTMMKTLISQQEDKLDLEQVMDQRGAQLQEKCQKFQLESTPVTPTRWYFMKEPNFMMCMIPKVASTSFSRYILKLHQFIKPRGIENLGYKISFEDSVTSDTFKAMVVRHPLDRIISAYRYVFQSQIQADANRSSLFSILNGLLLQNYRPGQSGGSNDTLTFKEFVRYLVNGTKDELRGDWPDAPDGREANFWTKDENINSHWWPFWKLCSPCNPLTQPNAIMKLDNGGITDEANLVFKTSKVTNYFIANGIKGEMLRIPWINPASDQDESRNLLRQKYFSSLTKEEVMQLYESYRIDHELFGYNVEDFLVYVKDG